jgi:hypothetical protein
VCGERDFYGKRFKVLDADSALPIHGEVNVHLAQGGNQMEGIAQMDKKLSYKSVVLPADSLDKILARIN